MMATKTNKLVVLVVDEDQTVQELTRDILELYGHTVLTPRTSDEAAALCEKRGKDITTVVLDTSESGARAKAVFDGLFRINPRVKLIATSIYSHDLTGDGLFAHANPAFLKKPYRMTELLITLRRAHEAA